VRLQAGRKIVRLQNGWKEDCASTERKEIGRLQDGWEDVSTDWILDLNFMQDTVTMIVLEFHAMR